ncbi:S-layer homology domain-containing protein [Peptococcus simiae]|uniref:S-layer homology domain-containing protein n=1 Tax=Peptococcus simiae TaxID=1643805 RepID=A0ABW9GVJ9_9FIRM
MREKNTVTFDKGKGEWKNSAPAPQAAANGLKLSESFMDAPDTIGPVTIPDGTKALTPPAAETGQPANEFKGWSDTEDGNVVDMDTYVVKGDTTFYAIYGPEAQGYANVTFWDKTNNKEITDPTLRLDDAAKYANQISGTKDSVIDMTPFTTEEGYKAPRFVGYTYTNPEVSGQVGQDQKYHYTDPATATLKLNYTALPDIVPGDKAQPDGYVKVTFHSDKETEKRGQLYTTDEKALVDEIVYYVNPYKGIKLNDANLVANIKAKDGYNVNTTQQWNDANNTLDSLEVPISDAQKFYDLYAQYTETTANKFKDKLKAEPIRVWKGEDITWKKGVALKTANADLQAILDADATKVTDLGTDGTVDAPKAERTAAAANLPNGTKGNLKVTFEDGSYVVVKDQVLYVAEHKYDKDKDKDKFTEGNLPADKLTVNFVIGEGVTGTGKTFYIKPNTNLDKDADLPAITAKTDYKDAKWYKGDANSTTEAQDADYTGIAESVTFTAKATLKGNGTAKLAYADEQGQTLEPATNKTLQIKGQNYAPELSGKDGTEITFTRDQAPKLLGYELVEGNEAVTITPAKYQEGQEATITLKYKKLDDVIPADPDKGGKDQPEGYVAVNFKDAKGAKVAGKDADVTFYVNPQAEVKVVEGDTATLVGKDDKVQNVPAVTADEGYKVVTTGDKKWPYDNHDKVGEPITTPTDFTANVAVRGNGTATLAYQDVAGNAIDPTTDALKIDKENYNPTLTGKHNTALPTYTEANAPKIRGYKFISQEPTDGKYNEDTPATITLKYEKRDDIIPAKPGEEKPDGYVTVTFQDVAGAKVDDKDANVSYYVNPKAEKKALIELNGDKYQIKGTKADKSEFTADVPKVTADDKYEVKYTDADKKWPYNNADKLNKAIEGDVTFTAQVVKIGEPTVTYPDVDIEKGKTQEITPDAKDKHGNPVPADKIGKVEVTEKPDGVTVTPADKGGKITVDVPKDYNGPSEFTIKVKVDLDGTPVTSEIKVKVKQPRTPGGGGGTIVIPSKPDVKPDEGDLNKDDHYQYLIGYPDGTFGPNRGMTRAEVATMFTRLLKDRPVKGESYTSNFTDVNAGDWYANTVGYAVQKGIVSGYPDGSFKPNQPITRAEFSAIAARFAGLTDEKDLTFTDLDASHWGYKAIRLAASHGWISGYPDNTFRPAQAITRAEVTSITNRMLNRYADLAWIDAHDADVIHFSDVARSDWFFEPVMEATMGHDFTRADGEKDEHWTGLNGKSFI